jgi:pyruvate dehydrogenase E2 component (dihydrolipoamide acetyltransferase)
MSNIRRKTAEHLASAWNTIPHVTQHDKADITALESLRKQYGPQAEQAGGKMTMTAIAMKIAASAMTRFPQFNASADMARREIVYKKAIHVGVAVDTERGLLVPVVRDADQLSVFDIAREVARLAQAARDGTITPAELSGSTITITNVGSFGMESGTPIINYPESAILATGAITKRPWVAGDQIVARHVMTLALSFDHRIIDGAEAGRFLRYLGDLIEKPARLFGVL